MNTEYQAGHIDRLTCVSGCTCTCHASALDCGRCYISMVELDGLRTEIEDLREQLRRYSDDSEEWANSMTKVGLLAGEVRRHWPAQKALQALTEIDKIIKPVSPKAHGRIRSGA